MLHPAATSFPLIQTMLKEDIKEVFTKDFLFGYQLVHVNLQQTEDCMYTHSDFGIYSIYLHLMSMCGFLVSLG